MITCTGVVAVVAFVALVAFVAFDVAFRDIIDCIAAGDVLPGCVSGVVVGSLAFGSDVACEFVGVC